MKLFGCLEKKEAAETATMASKISRKLKLRAFSTLLGSLLKPKKAAWEEKMNEFEKKGGAVRLKLVLTKKEAAQLLAMYVRGEEEMVDKLVGELENSSAARRTGSSCGAWRPMLESIPED